MKKKLIAGLLVFMLFAAPTSWVFADNSSSPEEAEEIYAINVNASQDAIEIISPKGNIIVQDSVLISVKILNNSSAILTVYKEPGKTTILGPENINPQGNLKFYTRHLKGLTPGDYKMQFDMEKRAPVIKGFTVKDKNAGINQSLKQIPKINILGNILKQLSQ